MTYKTECERCERTLSGRDAAFVCSYDCTFCTHCTRSLDWRCPNCGGELVRRPRRTPRTDTRTKPRPSARSTPVSIERATQANLDEASPLFDAYRQFYHQAPDPVGSREFLRERLSRDDSVIFLARRGGRAVGFAQLYPTFSSVHIRPTWNLNDLYVVPGERGRGVGSRLLERCQRLVGETGAHSAWLETAVDNPAQHLYAQHGWKLDREFLHFDWRESGFPVPRGARERPKATRKGRRARTVRS
jgi:GNAT superfamily N-acetyltransferase